MLLKRDEFKHILGNWQVFEITGKLSMKERYSILQTMLTTEHVLVFSLKTGGVGWNLLNTVNMYLLEPHWNPQLEAQTSDRVWHLHHFSKLVRAISINTEGSVNVRIHKVKQEKLKLSQQIFSGNYSLPSKQKRTKQQISSELLGRLLDFQIDLTEVSAHFHITIFTLHIVIPVDLCGFLLFRNKPYPSWHIVLLFVL